MKIIHGEDQIGSRNFFITQKQSVRGRQDQVVELDGLNLSYPDFLTCVGTGSLFGGKINIFIEQLFTRRPGKDKEQILAYLKSHPDLLVYIWENKDIGDQVRSFPSDQLVKFDLPKFIYQFLDTFSPALLQKALSTVSPEQILALLSRHMHNLILVKSGGTDLPVWQKTKLKSQSGAFSLDQLLKLHQELLDIDYHQKTSSSAFDLASSLEIWVSRLQLASKKV